MARLDLWLYKAMVFLGTVFALLVLIGVCWIVAQRYFLRSSLLGADELILLAAFWMYFMGAAAAARDRWHIRVNILDNLPEKHILRRSSFFIVGILNVGVSAAVTYFAASNLLWNIDAGSATPIFRIPTYWFDAAIVVAISLSTLYFVLDLLLPFLGLDRPTTEEVQL